MLKSSGLRKFFKILLRVFLTLIALILILYGLLQFSGVQTWLVDKVAANLSKKLNTRVSIKKVDFRFFNKILLEGVLVEDRKHDTLLYSGKLKAELNNWFIFKDRIEVKNVQLEHAIVHMNRQDSVWNYQFIVDYFSNPNRKKNSSGSDIDIDLREVHFVDIFFRKNDEWIGQDLTAKLQKLDFITKGIDRIKKSINVKSVYLEKPVFWQRDFAGRRPPQPAIKEVLENIPLLSAFKWNNSGWTVGVDQIKIEDGTFQNDKFTEAPPIAGKFDGKHLLFSKLNATMKDLRFRGDTLTMAVALAAEERSGLSVKSLTADMRVTPVLMEFRNLDLQTACSRLRNYYAMRFENLGEDFSSFISNVIFEGNFKDAFVCSDDLAFFAPALKTWKRTIRLSGTVSGTIDNFSAKEMRIESGGTMLKGNIAMRGLPDIKSTFIDFNAEQLLTSYTELINIIPKLRKVTKPAISRLGRIDFRGNFTGFLSDFVAYGNLNSSIGSVTADMNMKIPDGAPQVYSGKISTSNFNLGLFIGNPVIGRVTMAADLKGRGFTMNQLMVKVDGKINALQYKDYNYRDITVAGDFEKNLFVGHMTSADPNLLITSLDGAINFSSSKPGFQLQANVLKADLQKLGLTKGSVQFKGDLDLNFTGSTIDNFLGTARVRNGELVQDTNRLRVDSLVIDSRIVDGQKSLTLNTDAVEANVTGDFRILELPAAVTVLLSRYYPAYFQTPAKAITSRQNFRYSVRTYDIDPYLKLFAPKISGFNNAEASGRFNLQEGQLDLTARIPSFTISGKEFSQAIVKAKGTGDSIIADVDVENIRVNDSLDLPNTKLRVAASNDVSVVKLTTSSTSYLLGDAELNATVRSLEDGFSIHFSPSSFIVNNKKWELERDGELTVRNRFIDAGEIRFSHDDQSIVLSSELSGETGDAYLVAKLTKVNLADFSFLLPPRPTLKGQVTGTVRARSLFENPVVSFRGVADSLELDGSYLGKTQLEADLNSATGNITYKVRTDGADIAFDLEGNYNYKDTLGNNLNATLNAKRLDIGILRPYLSTVFSDIGGMATGQIKVVKNGPETTLIGSPRITDGFLKVAYTQVKYLFKDETIRFEKGMIDVGTMNVTDTLGNPGTMSGIIYHNFFKDFAFENIRFSSPRMLVLNTTRKNNPQFYGTVIGRANMELDGDVANMLMNIEGEPSSIDSSQIYLQTGDTREGSVIDYIEFIKFGSLMENDAIKPGANLLVNLDITANPACKIDVILDEETGDVIKGRGNGRLNLRVGTKEPMSIRGRYDLTEGLYAFNFQTFLPRPFSLTRGSIVWNGDPLLASIDMEAEYLAERVDISQFGINNNNAIVKTDIRVIASLRGNLTKPSISFAFKLPVGSEYEREFYIVRKLADFQNDENEMNKQVASLLLFNQFIFENQAFISGSNTIGIATSTIGGLVSNWLTSVFSKALQNATKGVVSTYIDVSPSLNFQQATQLQANVRAGLRFRFNGSLQLLVGGNLDYNNPVAQLYSRNQLTPDISLEWLLNKDGSLRVIAFNRTSVDFAVGQRNRSGLRFSYRRDADKFSDLFRSRKKLAELDSIRKARRVTLK